MGIGDWGLGIGDQTIPFSVPETARGVYQMYKIVFSCGGTASVSELELFGIPHTVEELSEIIASDPVSNNGDQTLPTEKNNIIAVIIASAAAVVLCVIVAVLLIVKKKKNHV